MKRFTYLLSLTMAAFVIAAVGMVGCEGPAGAAGADADATCKVCHNEQSDLLAKQYQASNSGHQVHSNSGRSGASCAACHTHEGYIDRMESGEMAASMDIQNATQPNCRTCHKVHEMYDTTDYDLRYTDAVALWVNDVTVDFGVGNTCANCHQPREISPYPTVGGAEVSITSSRWGPHHGPQAATVWGTSMYEIAGDASYPAAGAHAHAKAGCVKCHMVVVDEYTALRGGHTMAMSYDDHGDVTDNVDACVSCHSGIEDDFDYNGVMTTVEELYTTLGGMLVDKGWLKSDTASVNASSSAPLVLTADEAGALLNFRYVLEDKSMGIHNPAYIQAALKNSIQHLSN